MRYVPRDSLYAKRRMASSGMMMESPTAASRRETSAASMPRFHGGQLPKKGHTTTLGSTALSLVRTLTQPSPHHFSAETAASSRFVANAFLDLSNSLASCNPWPTSDSLEPNIPSSSLDLFLGYPLARLGIPCNTSTNNGRDCRYKHKELVTILVTRLDSVIDTGLAKPIGLLKERYKCPYFRILIIGRTNSGKTTILEKVCGVEQGTKPIIYDKAGELN